MGRSQVSVIDIRLSSFALRLLLRFRLNSALILMLKFPFILTVMFTLRITDRFPKLIRVSETLLGVSRHSNVCSTP